MCLKMKKLNFCGGGYQGYSSPSVESLDISVEQGFALSSNGLFGMLPGIGDWDDDDLNQYE